jgi:hypothetical protein
VIHQDFLFTIAEVGAAFAGFSTLISVIGLRSSDAASPTKVISMLILSILAVSFALIPNLIPLYELPISQSWRFLCLLYAIIWAAYWVFILIVIRRARFGTNFSGLLLANKINAFLVHPGLILALLAGAADFWGNVADRVYVTAVLVMLLLSAQLFVQIVISLLRGKEYKAK